jgi:hypothetical protein
VIDHPSVQRYSPILSKDPFKFPIRAHQAAMSLPMTPATDHVHARFGAGVPAPQALEGAPAARTRARDCAPCYTGREPGDGLRFFGEHGPLVTAMALVKIDEGIGRRVVHGRGDRRRRAGAAVSGSLSGPPSTLSRSRGIDPSAAGRRPPSCAFVHAIVCLRDLL